MVGSLFLNYEDYRQDTEEILEIAEKNRAGVLQEDMGNWGITEEWQPENEKTIWHIMHISDGKRTVSFRYLKGVEGSE